MKIKFSIYSLFILFLMLESCSSSKNVTYFQARGSRKGMIVHIPSYRNESIIRFQPDDILGITVNVPGEPIVALDYNLPLVPKANAENSNEENVDPGVGRQTFLVKKDGTIDFPMVGKVSVAGYTQAELEDHLKEMCMRTLLEPPIITVRLLNFDILVTGEVNSPGKKRIDKDNVNILEALALAGDMTIYGKRDNVTLIRQNPDGSYTRVSLDISRESIISSPYFFLRQNDELYIQPNNARTQSADISPRLNVVLSVTSFLMSAATFVILLTKK